MMILTAGAIREVEREERRALGAFRLVDHATGLSAVTVGDIEAVRAEIIDISAPGAPVVVSQVPLGSGAVDTRQNRRGWFVLFRAPLFDAYTRAFDQPLHPAELQPAQRLRLRLALTNAGPNHLPRLFDIVLPRSLDPDTAANVFVPHDVELLRAPGASVFDGWAVLRVSARQEGTQRALPGVLIRVFRRPRLSASEPIGVGMTEWRNTRTQGEAVVPIPGLPRFAPGSGANVFETTHAIELEATRDQDFPNAGNVTPDHEELPDIDALNAGVGGNIIRRAAAPANPALAIVRPTTPLAMAAGEELPVVLEMP
ncbi:MAG: hypothetical protein ACREH8_06145 [Opitutaceae bacterium]